MVRVASLLFFKLISKAVAFYWRGAYEAIRSKYKIHPSFRFNGKNIQFYGDGSIIAGEDSYIGGLSTVQASNNCTVMIGKQCSISHNVRIYTQSPIATNDFSARPIPSKLGNVSIGDYCWIGANVFIGPGIDIGRNAVIGANSVVSSNVPAGEIWGGVPAKLIKKKPLSYNQ